MDDYETFERMEKQYRAYLYMHSLPHLVGYYCDAVVALVMLEQEETNDIIKD